MAKIISSKSKITASDHQIQTSPDLTVTWPAFVILAAIIFLLSLANSMDSLLEKWSGLAASAIVLLFLITSKKSAKLTNYITPLLFSFFAYIFWGGISTFYAASGKFAIFEFSKLLVALCAYILVLFFTDPDQTGFKKISYLVASTGCFLGILSVDAASFSILFKIYKSVFGLFTKNFEAAIVYEQGIRINGIFGNPNTYAGFMAIAVILSLYLVVNASGKRSAAVSLSLLALNSLSYLLSFSMGSLFMFLIACLVMIFTSEKGSRVSLFLLMIETAVLSFIFAFVSMAGLGKSGAVSLAPDLALVLNALLLCQLDKRFRHALDEKMNGNIKLLTGIVVVIVVLVSGYLFAAFSVSSDLTLPANTNVMRAIRLEAGEYSLEIKSNEPVNVTVQNQNNYDLMRRTSTTLYAGASDQKIAFIVPDDSRIVRVNFSTSSETAILSGAHYSGVKSGDIHLKYPLLPGFIANRTQNLFANENVVQRTMFFEDGFKLFQKSPIIGRGLGGFENGVYSVQDFFYQTKYAHNHYIQVLSDLGLVGFFLFISVLIFSVMSVIKAKRKSHALNFVPVLAACLIQIFGQALTDAVWSTGIFLAFSAAILALITIFCSEPLKLKESINKNRLRIVEKVALSVFTGVFVLLLSGNLYAQAHAKAGVENFDEIKRLIAIDRFEYNDYKLSYIVNAPRSSDENVQKQAEIYANDLMKVESNSLMPYVMAYKFQMFFDYDAINTAKQGIVNNKSNPTAWIQMFNTLEEYIDPVGPNVKDVGERLRKPDFYVDSVVELYNMLLERNKTSLDKITLTPANDAFIGKMLEIQATHLYSIEWVFTALMTYAFDSECSVDANLDGLPDDLAVISGSAQKQDDGSIKVADNTSLELNLYHKLHGNYRFNIESTAPLQGVSVSLNGTDQTVVYEKENAYVEIYLDDNSNRDISKFAVTFTNAADIKNITFTTKLE